MFRKILHANGRLGARLRCSFPGTGQGARCMMRSARLPTMRSYSDVPHWMAGDHVSFQLNLIFFRHCARSIDDGVETAGSCSYLLSNLFH
jgi:hypothetical protein